MAAKLLRILGWLLFAILGFCLTKSTNLDVDLLFFLLVATLGVLAEVVHG